MRHLKAYFEREIAREKQTRKSTAGENEVNESKRFQF